MDGVMGWIHFLSQSPTDLSRPSHPASIDRRCLACLGSIMNLNSYIILSFSWINCREEHHKGKSAIPETQGTEEGSAKRNIARKHDHDPNRYVVCLDKFRNHRSFSYFYIFLFLIF